MITKIGKYNIIGELGQGAMGTVYKGEDPLIGRIVAIKTINSSALSGQSAKEAAARFKQEAQAAGRLSHPNIVVVYDYGEEGDMAYIAMAFIKGRELKSFFDHNELFALSDIVRLMEQLLDALHVAHTNKIVHRDIKPSNIMVNDNGQIMLTDFGIARLESSDLTQVGTTMGTPNYMAPEQCMGQRIDGRADIFSAAVILYQLLTGEKPFAGANITSIMHKILKVDPVPPSELNLQVPKAFDAVIAKGVAKRPDDRYATAHEFRQAIREAVGDMSVAVQDKTIITGTNDPAGDDETVVASGSGVTDNYDDGTVVAATTIAASGADEPEDGTITLESLGGIAPSVTTPVPEVDPVTPVRTPVLPSGSKNKIMALVAGVGLVAALVVGVVLFSGDKVDDGGVAPIAQPVSPVTVAEIQSPTPPSSVEPLVAPPVISEQPVSIVPSAAAIYVDTVPAQAQVMVDGVEVSGMTPLSLDLTSGRHELVVSLHGYYDVPVGVDVQDGDMTPLSITLYRK